MWKRNADHLLEEGAAIRCNHLPALAWELDQRLVASQLAALRANVRRLARPHEAAEVVAAQEPS